MGVGRARERYRGQTERQGRNNCYGLGSTQRNAHAEALGNRSHGRGRGKKEKEEGVHTYGSQPHNRNACI